jgi:hypothetical protein
MKITLNNSGVIFNQEEHRYFLDGKELSGITGLLQKHIFPDKYKDIPTKRLNRAAERGTMVHESIELLDGGFEPAEYTPELLNYKRIKEDNNLDTISNEYLVTDNEHFASAIDLVMLGASGDIALADIKTTSVLDKEYVRWQLSLYAYMFELQNPELKVSKLYALWLRNEKSELAEVERVDTVIVKDLLQCEVDGRDFVNPLAKADINVPAEIKNAEINVYNLVNEIKKLETQKKELSKGLLKLMQDNKIKSYKGEYITLSRIAASTREDIDKNKLKEKYPEAYAACMKVTNISEKLQIR